MLISGALIPNSFIIFSVLGWTGNSTGIPLSSWTEESP